MEYFPKGIEKPPLLGINSVFSMSAVLILKLWSSNCVYGLQLITISKILYPFLCKLNSGPMFLEELLVEARFKICFALLFKLEIKICTHELQMHTFA